MTRSARAYLATAVIVLALLLGLAVVANPFGDDSAAPEPGEPTASATPTLAPTPSVRPRTATGPGTPARILIPALEVDAPVVPIQSKDRVPDPPADASVLCWRSEERPVGKEWVSTLTVRWASVY